MEGIKRNYEVSVWTLQDDFITVLKPSNVEYKGLITDGDANLKDDGTQTFTFSIPMYIFDGVQRIVNPIWHTTKDGTIAESMRKIKLILNKGTEYERILEFVILKVKEQHVSDELYCNVECSGLAFEELGKIGYKISLSGDDFYEEDYQWFSGATDDAGEPLVPSEPHATIQYWNNKFLTEYPLNGVLNSNVWYYRVQINHRDETAAIYKTVSKIYEDEYVSSWDDEGRAQTVESYKEKERIIDIEESNIYNITQKIAETFGVFCRYDYIHDANYHIVGRIVTYYNTFLDEQAGYFDITYPFNTSEIRRERDSSNVTTKMFVRPVENSFSDSNLATIATSSANKSGEDYLLNFDYLYSIGTISKEQYDEIEEYENKLHILNKSLVILSNELVDLQGKLPELEGKKTVTENSVELDKETISSTNALFNSITSDTGTVVIGAGAPDTVVLLQDSTADYTVETFYFKAPRQGIIPSTLKIYSVHSSSGSGSTLSGELTGRTILDEYGCVSKIVDIVKSSTTRSVVYLTYEYSPYLYCEKVKNTWENKLAQDQSDLLVYTQELEDLKEQIDEKNADYLEKLQEKEDLVKNFERMMGPALREGYWQPEDYEDYGDKHTATFIPSDADVEVVDDNDDLSSFIWDSEIFDSEQDYKYLSGVTLSTQYYLCIDLSNYWNDIKDKLDQISFLFYDYVSSSAYPYAPRNLRSFGLGADCILTFIKNNNTPTPVLLVTGAKNLSDSEITNMQNTARLGILSSEYNSTTRKIEITISDEILLNNAWFTLTENTPIIYPRIKINSLLLKNAESELALKFDDELINQYADYYVLTREDSYYITIKPEVFFRTADYEKEIAIQYSISNADTSIYLDAKKIHKENAYPKVSYEVKLAAVNPDFLYKDYDSIGYICNINDEDLLLRNVQGYISEVSLKLDHIYEDSVVLKNYRNKFEDLFSSIVAQSEEMKKSAYALSVLTSALTAEGLLKLDTLSGTINENFSVLNSYVDARFDDYLPVSNVLKEIFTEAGDIIKDASTSLNGIHALTTNSGSMLASFAESVIGGLTPTVYTQANKPSVFKPGDVWIDSTTGNRYIAMSYSEASDNNGGWNRTYDGSLASITGAGIDIDAAAGTIDLKAGSKITLKAKSQIDLASGDVFITGNNSVNIGSKWINIGSTGGINIVTTPITFNSTTDSDGKIVGATSSILMDHNGIQMNSSDITMAASNGITMYASNDENITAVKINRTDGIYLGSNSDKGITIYSGNIGANGSSAAVEINKNKILFGVSNSSASTTAVEMTDEYVILAAGNSINDLRTYDPQSNNAVSGVKITKDLIGFATGTGLNRRAIIMDSDGVMISSGVNSNPNTHTGSYVNIAPKGIDLGASGNLYLNTSNIQLQTIDATGTQESSTLFALGTNLNNNSRNPSLVFDGTNLYVTGTVRASAGVLGGTSDTYAKAWKIVDGKIYSGSGTTYVALDSGDSGLTVNDYAIWAGNDTAADAPFSITRGGTLKATNANVKGTIYATNLYVGSEQTDINTYVSSATNKITYASTAPSSPKQGDLWYYTGTTTSTYINNAKYIYSGSGWVLADQLISGAKLSVNAATGDIVLAAANTLNLNGQNVSITGSGSLNIGSQGRVSIAGGTVEITSGGSFTVSSGTIALDSSGSLYVSSGNFSISPTNVSINGQLLNNGKTVLTSDYIIYSTTQPTANLKKGMLWLKPYNGGSTDGGGTPQQGTAVAVDYKGQVTGSNSGLRTNPVSGTMSISGATVSSSGKTYTYSVEAYVKVWDKNNNGTTVTFTVLNNGSTFYSYNITINSKNYLELQTISFTFTSSTWLGNLSSISYTISANKDYISRAGGTYVTMSISG